jgi:arylsulfatase A-like enzyme
MLHRIVALFVLAIVVSTSSAVLNAADAKPARPNIIYIMVDDLGYGDLGCFGQKVVKTPNIDKLAIEGRKFTDHYAGHTVCRPSRLVLWTGQHVGHTGLTGNRSRSLGPNDTTVASLLQKAGYATGGVGKWALGHVNTPDEIDNPGHPNKNGFDYWYGYMNQSNAHNYYPTFLWENDKQVTLPGNVIDKRPAARGRVATKQVSYSHDFMTSAALGFVERNHDKPFLLHVHWTIPHANNEGGRVNQDGMEIPSYGIYADKDWPNPEKGFAAMITHMDADVGRLMKLLKKLDIDEKTLVIFTSDNGPHNEGNHSHEYFDSNGPLTGFKRSMHEGGIRVPMIARWPGKIEAGTVSDHPSGFCDFLVTACEIAGAEAPKNTDGISYLPALLGQKDQKKHEYLYCESIEGATSVGVRHGDWKLVNYRGKKGKKRPNKSDWRLYDLSKDIGEQNNLAAGHPEVVRKILGFLERDGLLK